MDTKHVQSLRASVHKQVTYTIVTTVILPFEAGENHMNHVRGIEIVQPQDFNHFFLILYILFDLRGGKKSRIS